MKKRMQRVLSCFVVFVMTFVNVNFGILKTNAFAKEDVTQSDVQQKKYTVNDSVEVMTNYFNNKYFLSKAGTLAGWEYAAMHKAGADLSKKSWNISDELSGIDTFAKKANQSIILMDLGKDPSDYNNKNLIKEIADELNKTNTATKYIINEIRGMIAVDRFNEKFSDKKVSYETEKLINIVISTQEDNGCVDKAPINTAYAVELFSKHEDIKGVSEAKQKALNYLKDNLKPDGGIYGKYYSTSIHGEILTELVRAKENVTAECWTKDGKNVIDGLFKFWNGKVFTKKSGEEDTYCPTNAFYALATLKEAGYGDAVLSDVKFEGLKKEEPVKPNKPEEKKDGSTISSIIDGVINYYNEDHFIKNQSQLVAFEYSAMYRAGADLKKKPWTLEEKYQTKYDMNLKYFGSKVNQSLILIDLDKDANNYEGNKLIDDIAKQVDENSKHFGQIDIQGVIALDKYNDKFKDTKVSYNVQHAVEGILKAQCDDGGFKERQSSVPRNTAYALMALSKHRDIKGVDEGIKKGIEYLNKLQKDDGGIYEKTFITGYHAEIVQGLIAAGEDLTSQKWTKPEGKNPITALFKLWKNNNSFDGAEGESSNNKGWLEATWKSLHTLVDIKNAGYNNYVVDKVKVSKLGNSNDNQPVEKCCKVNVAIVMPQQGGYDCMFKPKEVTISSKQQDEVFTALGALKAATSLVEVNGNMVTAIYGYENKGQDGWVYTVNGVMPSDFASKVEVKDGDKVIWYYSMNSMSSKVPTWEELVTGKKEDNKEDNKKEDNKNKDYLKDVEEAIKSSSNLIKNEQLEDWTAIALKASGVEVSEAYLNKLEEKIKNRDKSLFDSNGAISKTTNCARTILGVTAVGGDPRKIGNYNLVEDLYTRDLSQENNIYSLVYTLIALDSGKFVLPQSAKFTRGELIEKITALQNKDGGFGYESDIDTTAMVLTALSSYKNNDKAKAAMDKIVEVLSKKQNEKGGYSSAYGESSESISQTIIGLCALGMDPTSEKFTKGGKNLLDALLSYKTQDGGFEHSKDNLSKFNPFANNQALQALAAYKKFKTGGAGSIYFFKQFEEVKSKDIKINNLTEAKEFKLNGEAKVTIQAINNTKDDKNINLVIGLFDMNNELVNYVSAKQNVKAKDTVELSGMMKLPKEGNYMVKAFVWDSLETMNILSNTVDIPVK